MKVRILFLVSLLFVAVINPYSVFFKFSIFKYSSNDHVTSVTTTEQHNHAIGTLWGNNDKYLLMYRFVYHICIMNRILSCKHINKEVATCQASFV